MSKVNTDFLLELIDQIQNPELKRMVEKLIDLEKEIDSEQSNYLRGWVCPKCGKVYSPTTSECYHCNNSGNWWDPSRIIYATDITEPKYAIPSQNYSTDCTTHTSQIFTIGK